MVWIVESGSCRVMFSQYLGDSLPQTHQLFLINIISYCKHHPYWPPSFLRCTPDRTAAFLRDYGNSPTREASSPNVAPGNALILVHTSLYELGSLCPKFSGAVGPRPC